jgi:8-oxo-dGTP diphosphatase
MTTCVGALMIRDQEVLLGRRAAHKSFPGCWDIPGGHVEAGEDLASALARELAEEIGVTPLAWRLLSRCEFEDEDGWSELLIYQIDNWAGEPVLANDEHVELRWFPLADACDLERLAAEEYRSILRSLRDAV